MIPGFFLFWGLGGKGDIDYTPLGSKIQEKEGFVDYGRMFFEEIVLTVKKIPRGFLAVHSSRHSGMNEMISSAKHWRIKFMQQLAHCKVAHLFDKVSASVAR